MCGPQLGTRISRASPFKLGEHISHTRIICQDEWANPHGIHQSSFLSLTGTSTIGVRDVESLPVTSGAMLIRHSKCECKRPGGLAVLISIWKQNGTVLNETGPLQHKVFSDFRGEAA